MTLRTHAHATDATPVALLLQMVVDPGQLRHQRALAIFILLNHHQLELTVNIFYDSGDFLVLKKHRMDISL